jgi:L,D-peptidoglycan transpeptidase YkuD (ErfK/YbiS/YcfS/YnhG family)
MGLNLPLQPADNSGMHMTRLMRRTVLAGLLVALLLSIMSLGSIDARAATYQAPAFAAKVPAGTTQVVRTVRTNRWCAKVYCTVTQAWVKSGGQWKIVTRSDGRKAVYRSSIGPNGFAAIGKRREGDGRTPSGVYTITVTFSTTTTNPGTMPWKRRKPTSVVTNYNNHLYNTWIEERWRTDGDRASMRYGFWVGYNNPRLQVDVGPAPVRGLGSGIFYHTSPIGEKWTPTLACTKVGEPAEMRWILRWLKPGAKPRVVNNI